MSAKNISNIVSTILVIAVLVLVGVGVIRLIVDNWGYLFVLVVIGAGVYLAATKLKS